MNDLTNWAVPATVEQYLTATLNSHKKNIAEQGGVSSDDYLNLFDDICRILIETGKIDGHLLSETLDDVLYETQYED